MRRSGDPSRGRIGVGLLAILAGVAGLAAAVQFFYCPCGRMPGGYLTGHEVAQPVTDWSFANQVPLCQVQVASWRPHSVNLNCMAADGDLFLSCGSCQDKTWSAAAVAAPRARLRLGERVYPVTLSRVTSPEVLRRAWEARARKLGQPTEAPPMEGWWSFQAVSRR